MTPGLQTRYVLIAPSLIAWLGITALTVVHPLCLDSLHRLHSFVVARRQDIRLTGFD